MAAATEETTAEQEQDSDERWGFFQTDCQGERLR